MKIQQLQYESDSWKRLLAFMMSENVHLKIRLSETLKNKFDKKMLDELETFQTRFVNEDQLINLLRYDIAELDELVVREIFKGDIIELEINTKINQLRNDISGAEREFSKLKFEFNNYLSEKL